MNRELTIYCDGGSRGNPGPAAAAFIVYEGGKEIFSSGQFLGDTTNNVAEYSAVLFAIEWLTKNLQFRNHSLQIILDSELVVSQLTGKYKIKNKNLQELAIKIKNLESRVAKKIIYTHVVRAKNEKADLIVNKTLDSIFP